MSIRRRDPILQINVQTVQSKVYKSPVPSYMQATTWLESKPKGIGRGEFHGQSEGSFKVGEDNTSSYRPTKKIYPIRPPYTADKPQGTKKLAIQVSRNPILEPEIDTRKASKKVQNINLKTSTIEDNRFNSTSCSKRES
jgi:hypothetical protein